jgi:hypothetical protein
MELSTSLTDGVYLDWRKEELAKDFDGKKYSEGKLED